MTLPDTDILSSIVSRVFRVEEVTLGDPKKSYFLRFRGELQTDSIEAYDQLAGALRPYDVTPLFRLEDGRQTILLVRGVLRLKPGKVSTNIILFVLTIISVLFGGAMYSYAGPMPPDMWGQIWTWLTHLWVGWPFAASLLGILLAHEFGHYFAGRYHKTAVSLPYFLPMPVPPLGTMGAFIQMKERPKNTRILFDIGVAGPLAGLVVAIPVLILGLALSKVGPVKDSSYVKTAGQPDACANTAGPGQSYSCPGDDFMEGNSPLYLALKYLVKGRPLPTPTRYDIAPVAYWLRYMFTGHPIPLGGLDVNLHPVALAGWAGLLVTFLNLIPAGQLDGGHVLYSIFGARVNRILPVILVITALLGFFWAGWWLWTFLIFVLGRAHAEPLDQITPLDPRRKAVALLMLLIFLLVLTPVPFTVF